MVWKGKDKKTAENKWTCVDGFKASKDAATFTKDTSENYNCLGNIANSDVTYAGDKGTFKLHFYKEYDPKSVFPSNEDAQDLIMVQTGEYLVDVKMYGGNADGDTSVFVKEIKGQKISLDGTKPAADAGDASGAFGLKFTALSMAVSLIMMIASSAI